MFDECGRFARKPGNLRLVFVLFFATFAAAIMIGVGLYWINSVCSQTIPYDTITDTSIN